MSKRTSALTARQLGHYAPVFAALGDETRLLLLVRLCDAQTWSISRLAEGSPITRQAITKHLRVLEDAGVVNAEIRGRERLSNLEPQALADLRNYLAVVSQQWEQALSRLKAFVEQSK